MLGAFGTVEKVTKIKDYAFVLFTEHQAAVDALVGVDKSKLGNEAVEISLATPKVSKTRSRYPSFSYRQPSRPNRYRRNHSFNQFKSNFGQSNKSMRKPDEPATAEMNDAAGTAIPMEQTIIPDTFGVPTTTETLAN